VKELKTLIADPTRRQAVVKDCAELIDSEVKSKGGLSGITVKAAFAVVKAFKPRMVEDAVEGMLDEFTDGLQPLYAKYQEEGSQGTFEAYLGAHATQVADALLVITDRKAEKTKHQTLAKAYHKLRPKGKVHVEQAAPGVGRVLDKHLASI